MSLLLLLLLLLILLLSFKQVDNCGRSLRQTL